jgi:dihydrofolate reductase
VENGVSDCGSPEDPTVIGRRFTRRVRRLALWGGAQVVNQYLAAGLLNELELHVVPILLGDGARLFDNLGTTKAQLEQVRVVEAPGVAHLKYRVVT